MSSGFYKKAKFPIHHRYKDNRIHTVMISQNVIRLFVNNELENGIQEQLISAYLGPSLTDVEVSCFANCINLTEINANNHVRKIADYAFYNCRSLTALNFLGFEGRELYNIGNYAFAGSGLKDIKINLKSSVSESSINSYAFANCKELEKVEFMDAPYLGPHMFDGCSKLHTVVFTNKHNYTYPYCFANCTALRSITLPANQYSLASHMFDGCTNLKEVKFEKNSILHYIEDGVFANCPSLTSLTLPASVNSLSVIDSEFLAGSSIKELTFAGIPDEDLRTELRVPKDIKYETGIIHNDFLPDKWNCAVENNVPIFAWLTKGYKKGCSRCDDLHDNVIVPMTEEFKTTGYIILEGSYAENLLEYDALDTKLRHVKLQTPGTWAYVYMYWKKEDGTEQKWTSGSIAPNKGYQNTIRSKWKELFAGYSPLGEIEYTIDPALTTFGRGSGETVVFISSSGQRYECTNDTVKKRSEYRVDKYTTDNFKFGIWYYNAKELKAFADKNNLPVLVERSSKGCEPCIDFRINTWSNSEFQNTIKTKPCLLCKVEVDGAESFDTPTTSQGYFVAHNWGKPTTYIPELVYYWKKADGSTYFYDWNYNYRTDPTNANYQTVLNRLDAMLGSYSGDAKYRAPAINACNNGQCQYYENEDGDGNGKYFICDSKTFTSKYNGSLNINVGDALTATYIIGMTYPSSFAQSEDDRMMLKATVTSLEVGKQTSLPKYTYQYFTSFNNSFYDENGIIFKVVADPSDSSKNIVSYIYEFKNAAEGDGAIKDTGKFAVGKMYSLDSTSAADGLNQLVEYGGTTPTKTIVIFKIQESDLGLESIIGNSSFTSWLKSKKYLFAKVKASDWTKNAPKALTDIENSIPFLNNNKSDSKSKILVFKHCVSCVATPVGVIGEVYVAKSIYYDSSKDISYYTALIDSCNV